MEKRNMFSGLAVVGHPKCFREKMAHSHFAHQSYILQLRRVECLLLLA